MREYELTVIVKSDLPEADRLEVLKNYETILKRSGGEILKKDETGSKRLAFPIKSQFRGHYVYYDLSSTGVDVAEAERLMRIDDNILRYLVVKINDEVDVEKRRAELLKAQQQTQAQDPVH